MIWHGVCQTSFNKLILAFICITQQGILNIFSLQAKRETAGRF